MIALAMARFLVAPARIGWPIPEPNVCYLKANSWDDFGFKTTFELGVVTSERVLHRVGRVKIGRLGLQGGYVPIPDEFALLDEACCSLGQDQNYYEQLMALPDGLGLEILHALRDCVADPGIWDRFRDEPVVKESLLRSVASSLVERTFREIVRGSVPATPFEFVFRVNSADRAGSPLNLDMKVIPHATPPTNVHVLIGRNGVGKSRLLAGMAAGLTGADRPEMFGIQGDVIFRGETSESGRFANIVTVAFSAFDRFAPLHERWMERDINYAYVGLRRWTAGANALPEAFKSPGELAQEFSIALQACLEGPRRYRWTRTVEILNADPGFAELDLTRDDGAAAFDLEAFQRLSSGHKIVLLTAAKLVELVGERTLVLFDEPESHLHPPLLSSLIRALSNLLQLRNGVAIIGTHSPVVLQEVPGSCVWVLRRSGDEIAAERPAIETFGENVGILTHEVFQLEVTKSGFHKMLAEAAETLTYDQIIAKFGKQIGAEGRAIARALTSGKRR